MTTNYIALCDIKGCSNPQCGEEVELEMMPPATWIAVVRIHPCRAHLAVLKFGTKFQITSGL